MIPLDWKGDQDDMEVMTEFVFREKLKNRKRYTLIEMWPEPETDDDEDEESKADQRDLQEDIRKKVTSNIPRKEDGKDEEPYGEDVKDEEPYAEDDLARHLTIADKIIAAKWINMKPIKN